MIKVLIISGYGINCETETAYAFEISGAKPEIVHINDLISAKKNMDNFDIMVFPGGFSYGDDTGSGNAFANKIKNNLWDKVLKFINDEKLILGICNGFQVMSNLGLFSLPTNNYGEKINALLHNDNNRYEDRWINLRHQDSKCVFTKGIDTLYLPIAHAEGKFFCTQDTLKSLKDNKQIVFRYTNSNGHPAGGSFPNNPNGSLDDVAGICDKTGRILGMMPHPERGIFSSSRPDFHLKKEEAKRQGKNIAKFIKKNLILFENAVKFMEEKKCLRKTTKKSFERI